MTLGRIVEGRTDPVIEADRDEKPIAEVAEEQRIAEKSYLLFLCDPPLLRVLRDRPFDGVRRIHRKTGRQQWSSGTLELLRNRDERRPPLPTKELIARLGGWKGHRVGTVERFEPGVKGARAQVWIELLGFGTHPRVCSGCQRNVPGVHDWSQREVRDLPVFDADTMLVIWRARVACPACGPKLEAMDMSPTFEAKVRQHCPNAEIVLDQFHVLANFGKQVLDRIRANEANRCRDDKAARELIKGAKWLLLGNWENIPNKESKSRLNELLEANQALITAGILRRPSRCA
jgi:hypothetical protein